MARFEAVEVAGLQAECGDADDVDDVVARIVVEKARLPVSTIVGVPRQLGLRRLAALEQRPPQTRYALIEVKVARAIILYLKRSTGGLPVPSGFGVASLDMGAAQKENKPLTAR